MKYILVTLLLLTTFISCEEIESYTFASLSWGSTKEEVKKCLIEKGYTFYFKLSDREDVYKGEIIDKEGSINLDFGYNNKLFECLIVLYQDEHEKPIEIYETLKDILIHKYGEPSLESEYFEDPYFKGDSYEEQAIQLGKGHFISFWTGAKDSSELGLSILITLEIIIAYRGPNWSIENNIRETKQAEKLYEQAEDL